MLQVFWWFCYWSGKEGPGICFFPHWRCPNRKKHEKLRHFFSTNRWDISPAQSFCCSIISGKIKKKAQGYSHTFNIDDFLGPKQKWAFQFQDILDKTFSDPYEPSTPKKIGGVLKYFIFSPQKLEEDEPNLTIIFFRWVGEKFNHQNDPKPCEQKNHHLAITANQSGYNWKNVHEDLEAGRVVREMMGM